MDQTATLAPRPRGVSPAFWVLLALCATPWIGPTIALSLGILIGLTVGGPGGASLGRWSKLCLQLAVVGLGFKLEVLTVLGRAASAIWYTAGGIALAFAIGAALRALLRTDRETSLLVTSGTAICGGSAIAAMAPTIRARDDSTAVALATVFTLNAVGLLVFPAIGRALAMPAAEFGVWAAIAIHDTSSVVGACAAYGGGAVDIGTTVKLTRALWILPMVFVAGLAVGSRGRAPFPLFLLGFLAAATANSLLPQFGFVWHFAALGAQRLLVVTLFLIGSGLTRDVLRRIGVRAFVHAVLLWIAISGLTLIAVRGGLIGAPAAA